LPGVERLVGLLEARRRGRAPFVVGVTGSVAVGKSVFAEALGRALAGALPSTVVGVVATDGFLLPNRVLAEQGLTMRKGFPESFDRAALAGFLRGVRRGDVADGLPVYDHFVYDVVEGRRDAVAAPDLLVIEGLMLLTDPEVAGLLDVSIYLDAERADIERWYVERFVANARRAAAEPGGFWDLFAGLSPDELRAAAAWTWREINLPNLLEHIEPTRPTADLVIKKASNHEIQEIVVQ